MNILNFECTKDQKYLYVLNRVKHSTLVSVRISSIQNIIALTQPEKYKNIYLYFIFRKGYNFNNKQ